MHETVEHLLKRHQAIMDRHEKAMLDAERRRRREEERLDMAYQSLRQRLTAHPDPDVSDLHLPPPPGRPGAAPAGFTGLLHNLRALLF